MADEGEHIHMEPQSNAGKWILMVVAVLVVAGFGYASYVNHEAVKQLTAELTASQNQVRTAGSHADGRGRGRNSRPPSRHN